MLLEYWGIWNNNNILTGEIIELMKFENFIFSKMNQ